MKQIHYAFNSDTTAIPYTGNDSLYFEIRNSDSIIIDTLLFISGEKQYSIKQVPGPMCAEESTGDLFRLVFKSKEWTDSLVLVYTTEEYTELVEITYKDHTYGFTAGMIQGLLGYHYSALVLGNRVYYNISEACDQKFSNKVPCENNMYFNSTYGILYLRGLNDFIFTRIEL